MEYVSAESLAVAAAVVGVCLTFLASRSRGGSNEPNHGAEDVDSDAWVYSVCDDEAEDAAGPFSPKDARRDSEEWNRTIVSFDTSNFDESDEEASDAASFASDDDDAAMPDNDDVEPEEEEEEEPERSPGSSPRMHLRKHHRRSWTHTNLDGSTEQRLHKAGSPYKDDGHNYKIVHDPTDAPLTH